MDKENNKLKLSLEKKVEVCSVILDTGFCGTPEEYVRKYYNKSFEELTETEADLIIRFLKDKKGCLKEVE